MTYVTQLIQSLKRNNRSRILHAVSTSNNRYISSTRPCHFPFSDDDDNEGFFTWSNSAEKNERVSKKSDVNPAFYGKKKKSPVSVGRTPRANHAREIAEKSRLLKENLVNDNNGGTNNGPTIRNGVHLPNGASGAAPWAIHSPQEALYNHSSADSDSPSPPPPPRNQHDSQSVCSQSMYEYPFKPPSPITKNSAISHLVKGGVPCDPAPPAFNLTEFGEGSVYTLILLRHGESEWNSQNRYTGWCDVNLTARGENEARDAGRLLQDHNIEIDHCFTSVLKRASHTTHIALDKASQHWVPITKSWRLNERHYGSLQGYNKDTAYKELNLDQELVMQMRRSYGRQPPMMEDSHVHWHGSERRYAQLTPEQIECSRGESLGDTMKRMMPFFNGVVVPSLRAGNKCMIVSHANTLRTLIKHIDGISDEDIKGMSIPTGVPMLYRLDQNLKPIDPKMELEFRYMVEPKGYTWATSRQHGFHGVYLGDLDRLQDIQQKRDATNRDWQRIILKNIFDQLVEEEYGSNTNDEAVNGNKSSTPCPKPSVINGVFKQTMNAQNASLSTTSLPQPPAPPPIPSQNKIVEVRQLWWRIHRKMENPEFSNMLMLRRAKEHLEERMGNTRSSGLARQQYLTECGFNAIVKMIHLDTEGHVIEPFEDLSAPMSREERLRKRVELLGFDDDGEEAHSLIR